MIRRPQISPLFPTTPLSRPPATAAQRGAAATQPAGAERAHGRRALEVGRRRRHLERADRRRSEEHTSELQSVAYLVCRLLLEKKKKHKSSLQQRTRGRTYSP